LIGVSRLKMFEDELNKKLNTYMRFMMDQDYKNDPMKPHPPAPTSSTWF